MERLLTAGVRRLGGLTVKLAFAGVAGVPDRLVLLPGLEPQLVELKADGGKLSAVQRAWHAEAASRGVPVYVLSGKVEVSTYLEEAMPDRIAQAAGRLSAAIRWEGKPGAPDEAEARAELAEAKLERDILLAVPILSAEQRERLARLLDEGDVL